MLRQLRLIVFLTSLLVSPAQTLAQEYGNLFRSFDASALSWHDKRFLQTALAFEGYYNGLIDGDWGRRSQDAMRNYSLDAFNTRTEDWHMAILAFEFFEVYERDGWGIEYFDVLDMSMLVPFRASVTDPATENFVNWRHSNSTLAYSVGVHSQATTQRLHDYTMNSSGSSVEPYSLRRTDFAITSVTRPDGGVLYTRSNFINGSWKTVMLSAHRGDTNILNAVASSINVGRAPQITVTENGMLETAILQTSALLSENQSPTAHVDGQKFIQVSSHANLGGAIASARQYEQDFPMSEIYLTEAGFFAVVLGTVEANGADDFIRQLVASGEVPRDTYATSGDRFTERVWRSNVSSASQPDTADEQTLVSASGTGFVVSSNGDVITNAHVIEDCSAFTFNGLPARLVATSDDYDLAILNVPEIDTASVALFSPSPAQLNSDVTVAGYPLMGILSGLNITRGAVSSKLGFGGEISGMQITAPVQSGNSGGPVLAADGEVVGIVVSKLDEQVVAQITGDTPQNVNFAIRGEIAKLFLFQNGIEPLLGTSDEAIEPTTLAEMATNFTGFIECSG